MSMMVTELYRAFRAAGVGEDVAEAAASSVVAKGDVATKTDLSLLEGALRTAIADAETRIIKWNVGTIIAVAALVFAIVRTI